MKHYIEITLLPGPDMDLHFIWEKVFHQIHLRLVELKDPGGKIPIGISFPEYHLKRCGLGTKLRFFAMDKPLLETLDIARYLNRFNDYLHLTRIRPIPDGISGYACYVRQQPKSSRQRLARRKARREGIEFEKALKLLGDFQEEQFKLPFITMTSQSTGRRFHLFILKQETDHPVYKGFSSYGLSLFSTVPEF